MKTPSFIDTNSCANLINNANSLIPINEIFNSFSQENHRVPRGSHLT